MLIFLGVFGLKFMPKIVNLLSNSNRVNNDKNDLIPPHHQHYLFHTQLQIVRSSAFQVNPNLVLKSI